jgi:hypothetical protein
MTDSDAPTVIVIPPAEPEPVIIASEPEPVVEAVADAISEVAEVDRMLDHETRLSTLEEWRGTQETHRHPEYDQPMIAPEPIMDELPPAPPEPEEIASPEPIEDSHPSRSHPLFSKPFGNGGG